MSFQLESSEMSSRVPKTSQMETLALLPARGGPIEVMLRLGPPLGTHLLLCRVPSTVSPPPPPPPSLLSPLLPLLWYAYIHAYTYRYLVCCQQQSNRAKLRFSLFGCALGSTRRRNQHILYIAKDIEILYNVAGSGGGIMH